MRGKYSLEQRKISKNKFDFLRQELNYCAQNDIITQEQCKDILSLYQIKQRISFVMVLVVIGSILIGLGILSFIAANWVAFGKPVKLLIIFSLFLGVNFASFKLEVNYPKTARSLLYLGVLIYGAGIFLIAQMYNFGGHFTDAFLLWLIGALPVATAFRDKIVFVFTTILSLVYLNGFFSFENKIPLAIFIVIPVAYYLNNKFLSSRLITFLNNIVVLNTIGFFAIKYEFGIYTILLFFGIGLLMYFVPIRYYSDIFKIQGSLIFGITGLLLTISDVWNRILREVQHNGVSYGIYASVVFAIAFTIFLLFLIRKGSLISLVFLCLTIFNLYFDISYSFMPKSLFFIIGGLLLLAIGYYFEKTRKKLGVAKNEQQEFEL